MASGVIPQPLVPPGAGSAIGAAAVLGVSINHTRFDIGGDQTHRLTTRVECFECFSWHPDPDSVLASVLCAEPLSRTLISQGPVYEHGDFTASNLTLPSHVFKERQGLLAYLVVAVMLDDIEKCTGCGSCQLAWLGPAMVLNQLGKLAAILRIQLTPTLIAHLT